MKKRLIVTTLSPRVKAVASTNTDMHAQTHNYKVKGDSGVLSSHRA